MLPCLTIAVCASSLPALQAATAEELCREFSSALQQEAEVLARVQDSATAEGVCRELSSALQQEAEVLARVQDSATAEAAVAPLREVLDKLAALKGQVDDNALWNYIDSTVDVKPELLSRLRNVALEFARLEKALFYGNADIASLLAPQLSRKTENSAAE